MRYDEERQRGFELARAIRRTRELRKELDDEDPKRVELGIALRQAESPEDRSKFRDELFPSPVALPQPYSVEPTPEQVMNVRTDIGFWPIMGWPQYGFPQITLGATGERVGVVAPGLGSNQPGRILSWDVSTGFPLRSWENAIVDGVRQIFTSAGDSRLIPFPSPRHFNNKTGTAQWASPHPYCYALSPDKTRMAIGIAGSPETSPVIRIVNLVTGESEAELTAYDSLVTALAFSPAGNTIVANIRARFGRELVVLDATDLKRMQVLESAEHSDSWRNGTAISVLRLGTTRILMDKSGRGMVTHGMYNDSMYHLRYWKSKGDLWNGEPDAERVIQDPFLLNVRPESDAIFLKKSGMVAMQTNGGVGIMNVADPRPRKKWVDGTAMTSRRNFLFLPGGTEFAIGDEVGRVRIWSFSAIDEKPRVFKAHEAPIMAMAASEDGRYLGTLGEENRLIVWNISEWLKSSPKRSSRRRR